MEHKNTNNTNKMLDETLSSIRNETLDAKTVDAAAQRVLAKLSNQEEVPMIDVSQIRTCTDFQSLIPAYLSGKLPATRTLLLEDHSRECLPCRKALKEARTGKVSNTTNNTLPTRTTSKVITRWLIAVAAILVLTLLTAPIVQRFTHTGNSVYASIKAVDGAVYRVTDTNSDVLSVGAQLKGDEKVRTAKNADAVIYLGDGSQIEMKERSEFYLTENNKGVTVHLERGNIIIQTPKQSSRALYVATNDCLVSATGAVFSVNSGIKGSRVSVIEGNAQVDYSGQGKALKAGEQTSTNANLSAIPIKEEISWSRDSEKYSKLLAAFSSVRKDINTVALPGVRYSTDLLDVEPAQTVFYVALPNFSSSLAQSYAILQQHLAKNAALQEWWNNSNTNARHDELITKIITFGQYLGDEIVISAGVEKNGSPSSPLILSKANNPTELRNFLTSQLDTFNSQGLKLHIINDPLATSSEGASKSDVYIWVTDSLFVASHNLDQLRDFASNLNVKAFVNSSFHNRITQVYQEGAGLILAADLEKIIPTTVTPGNEKQLIAYKSLGFLDLKHFIAEQKVGSNTTQNRAVLTFKETRTGLAAWIADPGPIGGLEFVSPDANLVTASVVKDPGSLVNELFKNLGDLDPTFKQHLEQLETLHQVNIARDFAAPLGGEFVFAVDGPIIPTPAWKAIIEVYDAPKLQASIEHLVSEVNRWTTTVGKKGLQLEKSELNGRTFYTIKSLDSQLEFTYTFSSGYLIASPSRALVDQALRFRDSGYTLTQSAKFTSLLPSDTNANFSGLLYHNLAPVLAPIADQMAKASKGNSPEQNFLQSVVSAKPTLAYAYAQGDRISFVANGDLNPFNLSPASLLGLPNALNIQKTVTKTAKAK